MAENITSSQISLEEFDFDNLKSKLVELSEKLKEKNDRVVAIPIVSTKTSFENDGKQLEWIKLLRLDSRIVSDLLEDYSKPKQEAERVINENANSNIITKEASSALHNCKGVLKMIDIKERAKIQKFQELKKHLQGCFEISLKSYDFVEEKLGIKYYKRKS